MAEVSPKSNQHKNDFLLQQKVFHIDHHSTPFTYVTFYMNHTQYPTIGAMLIEKPTVIAMVGLPARGKTFISKKLLQYAYNQLGLVGRVFNVGDYRRLATDYSAHDFFRSDNKQALAIRK